MLICYLYWFCIVLLLGVSISVFKFCFKDGIIYIVVYNVVVFWVKFSDNVVMFWICYSWKYRLYIWYSYFCFCEKIYVWGICFVGEILMEIIQRYQKDGLRIIGYIIDEGCIIDSDEDCKIYW